MNPDVDEFLEGFGTSILPDDVDLSLGSLKTVNKKPIPTAQLLKINRNDLQSEFESYAAWLAVVSLKVEYLEIQLSTAQRDLEKVEASAYLRSRARGVLKKTEKTLEAEIVVEPDVDAAFNKVQHCKQVLAGYKALRGALYSKRDMLQMISKGQRIDMMTTTV
jgi:hypothetical protein